MGYDVFPIVTSIQRASNRIPGRTAGGKSSSLFSPSECDTQITTYKLLSSDNSEAQSHQLKQSSGLNFATCPRVIHMGLSTCFRIKTVSASLRSCMLACLREWAGHCSFMCKCCFLKAARICMMFMNCSKHSCACMYTFFLSSLHKCKW